MSQAALPNAGAVLPVSLLVSSARLIIERNLALAWIAGEVSNVTRAASGHFYFQLKDERAQVRCVMFRQKAQHLEFALKEGLQVEVRAAPTIYEARGEFQLNVETIRLAGLGALYERYAKLKATMEAAGWFAAERKRPIPAFPRAVGIVTSRQAAALRDVLTTLARRMPALPVTLYPTPVQGADAAASIAAAIRFANERNEVDVLIVCRGGGSIEDLWAFNEEPVARAVFESRLPIVSGVGHETDFTLCDLVADERAPTPTAAAARVAPDREALLRDLGALFARWRRANERALELQMQRVDLVSRRLVHPDARLGLQASAIAELARRLGLAVRYLHERQTGRLDVQQQALTRLLRSPLRQLTSFERSRERWQRIVREQAMQRELRLATLARSLRDLNPRSVLERGYSIVTNDTGAIVQSSAQIAAGDSLQLSFARGGADATVTRIK